MQTRIMLVMSIILAVLLAFSTATAHDIDSRLAAMTLEEKIGQMLFPAFRTQGGRNVTEVTPEIAASLRRYQVGGVILFGENLISPDQTRRLIARLQAETKVPLFIGVDQEGGRVSRLPYRLPLPGNMALAATGRTDNAFLAGKAIGDELAELGFNLNFAPVLDVNSNPDNPVIGVRSFGEDPAIVASFGRAFIRGLNAAGVAAVIKHFPGHGDTQTDSHLGLPVLSCSLEQLATRELEPFRQAFRQSPAMVMTAHIALPALEQETALSLMSRQPVFLPATLSRSVLTGLLRDRLGYNGIIITDALNMKAITDHFGPADAAVRAVTAGADMLLMPELEASFMALLAAVKQGKISEERINQSVRRILAAKQQYGLFNRRNKTIDQMLINERAALAVKLAEQAVTLLKNEQNLLPFALRPGTRVLLLAPSSDQLAAMHEASERIFRAAGLTVFIRQLEYQGNITDSHLAALEQADQIILASDSAAAGRVPARQSVAATAAALIKLAETAGKPIAVIAVRNPYDIRDFPFVSAYLAVYAPIRPNIAAGIKAIYGQITPQGRLPVTIPDPRGGILYPRGWQILFL